MLAALISTLQKLSISQLQKQAGLKVPHPSLPRISSVSCFTLEYANLTEFLVSRMRFGKASELSGAASAPARCWPTGFGSAI